MGKSGQARLELWTVWPRHGASAPEVRTILCPALDGLPQSDALALAILPIHDANGLLLDVISHPGQGPAPDYAGVCLSDPFRRMEDILAALRAKGIGGVINMPSVSAMTTPDEEGPFDHLYERETELLARSRAAGFTTLRIDHDRVWAGTGGSDCAESCLGNPSDIFRLRGDVRVAG